MPLALYFSDISSLKVRAAVAVILGTPTLTTLAQSLLVLYTSSLNETALAWFLGRDALSISNVMVSFATGSILSIVILIEEIVLVRATLLGTFYITLFSRFITVIPGAIVPLTLVLIEQDVVLVLVGLLGLGGMVVGFYWLLLLILFFGNFMSLAA